MITEVYTVLDNQFLDEHQPSCVVATFEDLGDAIASVVGKDGEQPWNHRNETWGWGVGAFGSYQIVKTRLMPKSSQ